jgi:hypothetical protein
MSRFAYLAMKSSFVIASPARRGAAIHLKFLLDHHVASLLVMTSFLGAFIACSMQALGLGSLSRNDRIKKAGQRRRSTYRSNRALQLDGHVAAPLSP